MSTNLKLISHVCESVNKAEHLQSRASPAVLSVDGMSSPKVRHLLNNLCSMPDCCYLEVGSWKGSTLCSALDGNTLGRACAVENFSEFTDPVHCSSDQSIAEQFHANLEAFKGPNSIEFINGDYFNVPLPPGRPFNVYFYDGAHTEQTQYYQIHRALPHLANRFVLLVDDWFCKVSLPQKNTFRALGDCGLYVHLFIELPEGITGGYWSGQGLFVVEKRD